MLKIPEIECTICGEPGTIYWSPWTVEAGVLAEAGAGCYSLLILCDSHYASYLATCRAWLKGAGSRKT